MISIQDMLRLKEQELGRLQKEIDALRLVASLYGESAMIDANRPQAEVISPAATMSAPAYAPMMTMTPTPAAVAAPVAAPAYASAVPAASAAAIPSHGRNGGEKRFP